MRQTAVVDTQERLTRCFHYTRSCERVAQWLHHPLSNGLHCNVAVFQADGVSLRWSSSKMRRRDNFVPMMDRKLLGPKKGKKGLREKLRILVNLQQLFFIFFICLLTMCRALFVQYEKADNYSTTTEYGSWLQITLLSSQVGYICCRNVYARVLDAFLRVPAFLVRDHDSRLGIKTTQSVPLTGDVLITTIINTCCTLHNKPARLKTHEKQGLPTYGH